MKYKVIILFILWILMGCKTSKNMIYYYYDGSGNMYKIENQVLEYSPVSPEKSSSGIYSGGEPFQKKLTKEQYEKIVSLLETAFQSKEEQTNQRMMMTGMVVFKRNNEKNSCILLPEAISKKNIEVFLQQLKNQ
jgi:hypothetical protein